MAHEVLMPKLSSTMSEGTITTWLKNEGENVEIGEAIFEVMTDKIAIEVEAYEEGVLLKRYIGDGESAPVNAVVAYIGEAGEAVPEEAPAGDEAAPAAETAAPAEAVQTAAKSVAAPAAVSVAAPTASLAPTGHLRATPAARRLAREKGLELRQITGTGPKGRIQLKDVAGYQAPAIQTESAPVADHAALIPWSGMRKVIADRMQQSSSTVPHVTMNAAVDMQQVVKLRNELLPMIEAQTEYRVSFLEIIAKAVTVALKRYPIFNAHALEAGIQKFESVNLGIAVAVEDGLVVPVIKEAQAKGLGELTTTVKTLTEKARNGQLKPAEMSGGTFTISSLGKSRVKEFTPIINQPEVAILGVGGMYDSISTSLYNGMDMVQTTPTVNLSLSFDHRVVDGAPAAEFLSYIAELLETPMSLLV